MTLPPALQKSLEAEEVQVTPLQASVWSEGRAGADLLIEAKSGPETTTALAVLVLDRLVAAISSAEAALPRYARKRTSSFSSLSGLNRIVSSVLRTTSSNNGNSNVKDGESDLSTANGSSGSGGLPKPQLCALVLTKNREVAAGVKDTLLRLGKTSVPNLTIASLVGGIAVSENAQTLSAGCHVAIGTPGRVKFLIDKGVLVPDTGRLLVLESADWLMAPVFMVNIEAVYHQLAMLRSKLAATAAANTDIPASEAAESTQMENALLTLVEANVRVVEGQRHALENMEKTVDRMERMFRRLHMRLDLVHPGDVSFS